MEELDVIELKQDIPKARVWGVERKERQPLSAGARGMIVGWSKDKTLITGYFLLSKKFFKIDRDPWVMVDLAPHEITIIPKEE